MRELSFRSDLFRLGSDLFPFSYLQFLVSPRGLSRYLMFVFFQFRDRFVASSLGCFSLLLA